MAGALQKAQALLVLLRLSDTMGRTAETLIPLRASLFPQVPPYVLFSSKDDGDFRDGGMDWHIKRNGLLWQHVYDCVQRSGFTLSEVCTFEGSQDGFQNPGTPSTPRRTRKLFSSYFLSSYFAFSFSAFSNYGNYCGLF